MEYRTLGRTGLRVSVASLGTGGQSRLGQATHGDRRESERVVRRALELGINLIDTAPNYADTEELLGEALADVPRADYLLSTKAESVGANGTVAAEAVVASCERSLRRLRTDYVDLFQLHNVPPDSYQEVVDRLYPALVQLKGHGKVRFVGITERQEGRSASIRTTGAPGPAVNPARAGDPAHRMLERALDDSCWDAIGVKYGILNQVAAQLVLPKASAHGVGVLNMSAVRIMLARPDQLEALMADWKTRGLLVEDALPEQDPLGFLVHGDTPSVIAAGYRFAIGLEAISSVVVGTGDAAHLEANVAAILGPPLAAEDSLRLRQLFGHIAEGV
jgi:L-galactose dehydrogenase